MRHELELARVKMLVLKCEVLRLEMEPLEQHSSGVMGGLFGEPSLIHVAVLFCTSKALTARWPTLFLLSLVSCIAFVIQGHHHSSQST